MSALLALLPCAAVILAVLGLRWSGLAAACLALAVTVALWGFGVFIPPTMTALTHALADGALLTALVLSVIVPGLLYVEICRRVGSLQAVNRVIAALRLDAPRAVVVIAIGVGVTLESLTGFGVSLLVSVPLLLTVLPRPRVVPIALIGMSLMPWGALSVSALLGAELADMPVDLLADRMITTSGPVAFALPLACLLFVPRTGTGGIAFAAGAGVALVAGIAATTHSIGVEVAGVGGGLAVLLLAALVSPSKARLADALAARPLALLGLLIAAVVAQKLLVTWLAGQGIAPVVSSGRLSLAVFSTPGIALFTVGLIGIAVWPRACHRADEPSLLRHTASRSWRAMLTVLVFLATARLLVETGGIAALADLLASAGAYASVAFVSGLAAVGSYITGSAIPSAALFMASAAATGKSFGHLSLFAALQLSAAGHMAMASLPIVAILMAALPDRQRDDERGALRWGLVLASVWMALVIASGWLQLALF